jgi:hypothetical protein
MSDCRAAAKTYCSRAIMAAVGIGAVLILAGLAPLGKGLIAGTLFSILNFVIMAESLPQRIGKTRRMASLSAFTWLLLRYALMAVPLVLAIKFDYFHPAAAAVGLFAVQLVILFDHFRSAISPSRGATP